MKIFATDFQFYSMPHLSWKCCGLSQQILFIAMTENQFVTRAAFIADFWWRFGSIIYIVCAHSYIWGESLNDRAFLLKYLSHFTYFFTFWAVFCWYLWTFFGYSKYRSCCDTIKLNQILWFCREWSKTTVFLFGFAVVVTWLLCLNIFLLFHY